MEWQVFCFSVLHLGPFYFKSFGACAISTPNNIRSKRHLWQKENIVQMRSGFLWFRSAAWVDLRISNDARRIKSVRVTFITRFRNSAREPVKYRSLIQKQLWLHKNRKLFKLHLNSRLYRNILSPVYQRTQRQMQQFLCRSMAFRSESQMQRPKVQSFILCQRCIACVRRSVRCIEDLPDHRQDRYEKKLRWLNGDYSW